MAKNLKKAFSMTDLVIVIAIVAIFVVLLVPTLTSIAERPADVADAHTAERMNVLLKAQEEQNGKPKTMSEVVDLMAEHGYLLEKMVAEDGQTFAWDEENNRFVLLSSSGEVVYSDGDATEDNNKLWQVVDEIPVLEEEDTRYSYYLSSSFEGTEVSVMNGVDVGEHTGIDVLYNSAALEEVTIRTNGGTLTIEALNATVNHYGMAESVHIQRIAKDSYHLYGQVQGAVTLVEGFAVLESGSSADTVLLAPINNVAENVILRVSDSASLSAIAARVQSVLDAASIEAPASVQRIVAA